MSPARWLESQGVRLLAEGDTLTLEGMAALTAKQAAEVLSFARKNKARLLEELGEPVGLPSRLCLGCGKPFTPSDESKVYCQAKCFNSMRGLVQ